MAVGGLLLYSVREEETDKEYRDRIFELEKYEKLKETADVFNLVSMDDPDDEAPMTYVRRRNTMLRVFGASISLYMLTVL